MSSNSQSLIRQIVAHVKCAVCGHHFGVSDIQVVGRRDQVWAMRVSCRECRTQALLLAVVNERGMRPVYTDLYPDEWSRFRDAGAVSTDDLIRLHQYLAAYGGDFGDLLDEPLPDE